MYGTPYTLADIVADVLDKARQPAANYTRYSETSIKRAINAAQVEMVGKLKCLHSFAIILLKSGYAQYAAPSDMISPKNAFFYQTPKSYYELKIKSRQWLDQYTPGWRQQIGSPPIYMYAADSLGYTRSLGVTPTPNVDGDNYLIAPDTGVVISGTGLTTSGNITGQNNAASATICTDSLARTLSTLGITVGMVVLNSTDNSKGQISNINGSQFTAALTGGTNNTWGVSDSFVILAGEYGVVTSIATTDEQYIFNTELGEMINISALTNNIYMEYYRLPIPMQFDTQYPEVPIELHEFISDGALWRLKRTSTKGSDDMQTAMASKQVFDQAINSYMSIDKAMDSSGINFNW